MSETSILPGSSPATDAGVGAPPPIDEGPDSAGGDRRRLMMIVGAGAGIVVLAIVAFLLLHKGSSTPAAGAPGVVQTAAPTGTNPGGSKGHKGGTTVPKVQKHPKVHNPFVPLIQPPVANQGSLTSTTTVTNATPSPTPSTSTTVLTGPGSVTPTSPTTVQTSAPPVTNQPVAIELFGIHGDMATFHVFYPGHTYKIFKVQAPKPTQERVFDTEFALIGITGDIVTIQIADGAPFNLQTGISHKV